eukprot:GSChrysophyteH1.ASY1.ANO1.2015.1 assembled CDS
MLRSETSTSFVQFPADGPLPVVRIFGSTPAGQKTLLHIHGCLPYFYFRPSDANDTLFGTAEQVNSYLTDFHQTLEAALQRQLIREDAKAKRERIIGHLECVERTSIYGMQPSQWFVKVHMRKPPAVRACKTILETTTVLGDCFGRMATWEAHIPFVLQVISDLNIKPTGWVHVRGGGDGLLFRHPLPTDPENWTLGPTLLGEKGRSEYDRVHRVFTDKTSVNEVDNAFMHVPDLGKIRHLNDDERNPELRKNLTFKESNSDLEIDVSKSHILNAELQIPHFGYEFIESEVKRRNREGLTPDVAPQVPFSETEHRPIGAVEVGYRSRLTKLRRKGSALAKAYRNASEPLQDTLAAMATLTSACTEENEKSNTSTHSTLEEEEEAQNFVQTQKDAVLQQRLKGTPNTPAFELGSPETDIDSGLNNPMSSTDDYSGTQGGNGAGDIENSDDFMLNTFAMEEVEEIEAQLTEDRFARGEEEDIEEELSLEAMKCDLEACSSQADEPFHGTSIDRLSQHSDLEIAQEMSNTGRRSKAKRKLVDVLSNENGTLQHASLQDMHDPSVRQKRHNHLLTSESSEMTEFSPEIKQRSSQSNEHSHRYSKHVDLKELKCFQDTQNCNTHAQEQPPCTALWRDNQNTQYTSLPRRQRLLQPTYQAPSQQKVRRNHATNQDLCSRFTTTSIELFCRSSPGKLPNPYHDNDSIQVIVLATEDVRSNEEFEAKYRTFMFLVVVEDTERTSAAKNDKVDVSFCADEKSMFQNLIECLCKINPDLICGYDIQRNSVGFILSRAVHLKLSGVQQSLSRLPLESPPQRSKLEEEYLKNQESGIYLTGRIVLNLWRRMRAELKLNNYSLGNVTWNLLNRSVPIFSSSQLNFWYSTRKTRFRTIRYIFRMAELNLDLMDGLDMVRRTCESARLYGIDFFSVLTRGSQYRVEAALATRAHQQGMILLSPSKLDVSGQSALKHIALVMEPKASFYKDPVVVLDFQSLYPSICIAYNLCFSTCFGSVRYGDDKASAALDLKSSYVSPSGAIFASEHSRSGVLPSLLRDLLNLRQMIKRTMKLCCRGGASENRVLYRVLDARQLAIKLLANVTYGYTAASFSGRMPMSELADAIVSTGRAALEWTIKVIESNNFNKNPSWGSCKVVYGDTDSVFINLPNRTKDDAFFIGRDISRVITSLLPESMVLKFEKVYHPSILVAKKRYVGNSYENEEDQKAVFDCKGLEYLSKVKKYLVQKISDLLEGLRKVPISRFIFSKEVRMGEYRRTSSTFGNQEEAPTPGAVLAQMQEQYPLVVLASQRTKSPKSINTVYYVEKCILPALERVLVLCGADARQWYIEMTRPSVEGRCNGDDNGASAVLIQQTMSSYLSKSTSCASCGKYMTKGLLCDTCKLDRSNRPDFSPVLTLYQRLTFSQIVEEKLRRNCESCSRQLSMSSCANLDCSIFHVRSRNILDIEDIISELSL